MCIRDSILLRPKVSDKDLTDAITRLDSIKSKIDQGKVTFEEAALYVSQDKDSKLNKGIMTNEKTMSSKFEMADLNPEIGKVVDKMQVGDVSEPFVMMNPKTNREMVAIVKLTRRIEGHKAELAEDYQQIKGMYENSQRQKIIADWIKEKQKKTYVRIEEGWRDCEFQYQWAK